MLDFVVSFGKSTTFLQIEVKSEFCLVISKITACQCVNFVMSDCFNLSRLLVSGPKALLGREVACYSNELSNTTVSACLAFIISIES